MALELEGGQDAALVFCNQLLQVLRLVRLYDADNVTFEDPLTNLKNVVMAVSDRMGSARIQSEEGMLYFNKDPVRGGRRVFATIQGLVKALEQAGIAELAFTGAVTVNELRQFCGMIKPPPGEDMADLKRVQAQLEEAKLKDRIQVYAPGETTGSAQVHQVEIDEQSYFPLAYARTLVLMREYVKNLRTEELNRYFSQKLYRALQELCGLVSKYEHKFHAMAAVRNVDDTLFTHMANTGLLSILLGHHLGVGRVKLSDLALAGMLHGLGKFRTRRSIVETTELNPTEAQELGLHPYRAMGAILEGRKITTKNLTAAVVCFQYDLHRGTTPLRLPPTLHPFAMIVRVAEEYDWLTTDLPDRPALLPDQALRRMIESPKNPYDPMVLTVFTNMMGLFPTGACVSLSSGEVAIVVHPNPEKPKRPLVAIVMNRDGRPVDGEFLDLAEKIDGQYPAEITGSLDPSELGINVPDYLLA